MLSAGGYPLFFPGEWRIAAGERGRPWGYTQGVPVEAGGPPANSVGDRGIPRGAYRALWRSRRGWRGASQGADSRRRLAAAQVARRGIPRGSGYLARPQAKSPGAKITPSVNRQAIKQLGGAISAYPTI